MRLLQMGRKGTKLKCAPVSRKRWAGKPAHAGRVVWVHAGSAANFQARDEGFQPCPSLCVEWVHARCTPRPKITTCARRTWEFSLLRHPTNLPATLVCAPKVPPPSTLSNPLLTHRILQIPPKCPRRGRTTAATRRAAATSSPSGAPTARDAPPRTRPSSGSPSATWLSLPPLVRITPFPSAHSLCAAPALEAGASPILPIGSEANCNRRHPRGLCLRQ